MLGTTGEGVPHRPGDGEALLAPLAGHRRSNGIFRRGTNPVYAPGKNVNMYVLGLFCKPLGKEL